MGRAGTKRMEERRYSNYTYVHGRSKYRQMPHRSASRADAALEARPAAATDLSALHHSMCAQFTMMVTLTRPKRRPICCDGTYRTSTTRPFGAGFSAPRPVAHSAAARRSPPALECGTVYCVQVHVPRSKKNLKK